MSSPAWRTLNPPVFAARDLDGAAADDDALDCVGGPVGTGVEHRQAADLRASLTRPVARMTLKGCWPPGRPVARSRVSKRTTLADGLSRSASEARGRNLRPRRVPSRLPASSGRPRARERDAARISAAGPGAPPDRGSGSTAATAAMSPVPPVTAPGTGKAAPRTQSHPPAGRAERPGSSGFRGRTPSGRSCPWPVGVVVLAAPNGTICMSRFATAE